MIRGSSPAVAVIILTCLGWGEEPAGTPEPFRFSGEEQVDVRVFVEPPASLPQRLTDGELLTPLGGRVKVRGLTLKEATEAVRAKVREVSGLKDVDAGLVIMERPVEMVQVFYEGGRGWSVPLPRDREYHVLNAISAGNLSESGKSVWGTEMPNADFSRIRIIRTGKDGQGKTEKVDMTGFPLGPVLRAGDVVIIPERSKSPVFGVLGEVNRTGVLARSDTKAGPDQPVRLSDVVVAAGGMKTNADRKQVRLVRLEKGQRQLGTYNLEAALEKGDLAQDPEIRDGDLVIVSTAEQEGIMVAGRVKMPGLYTPTRGSLTITQLILTAGGFEPRAKSDKVMVFRKEKPGEPLEVDVESILKQGRVDLDLQLNGGDRIYVPERWY